MSTLLEPLPMSRAERFALGSLAVGLVVLGLKAAAWWITDSAALYSDALESIVNVAASLIAFGALRFAALPADANHPYGHDKAEFFAAVIEGVLIVIAALSIFQHAWETWLSPRPLGMAFQGVGLNAIATGCNMFWSIVLMRTGKQMRSPALRADGVHLLTDVVTSIGILIGVVLTVATGYLPLDPILAAATGIYVLWSGMRMIGASVGGLMDAAPEPAVLTRIRELVAANAEGAIEAHDLRTRHAGRLTFLDFHLVVPGSMTVAESHLRPDRGRAARGDASSDDHDPCRTGRESQANRRAGFVKRLLLAAFLALVKPAKAAERVVSLNLCADQMLVLLAPEKIVALSVLARDPALSFVAKQARNLPIVRASAEAVLRLRPDLVVAGRYGAQTALALLERQGVRILRTDPPQDFDTIRAWTRALAAELEHPERGEALIGAMDATLAAIPAPTGRRGAIAMQPRGYTAGPGSTMDAAMRAAGLTNLSDGRRIGLEALLRHPPDMLIVPSPSDYPSLATAMLDSPVARGLNRRFLPPSLTLCAGPFTAEAAAMLSQ
jgi:cation diffusion facilitator family transporter